MCRTPTQLMEASTPVCTPKRSSSPCSLKVDSTTIMKSIASSWTFRLAWAPTVSPNGESSTRYDVQLIGWGGKRHTFRTPDDMPAIVLPYRLVREQVGDTFTAQIRVLNLHGVGAWSEVSSVLNIAKPSPTNAMVVPKPFPLPKSPSSQGEIALEALPYVATRKAPAKFAKKDGNAAKRPGSIFERLISGFKRRSMEKASTITAL